MSFQYPLILDGGFATELERSFAKDLSGNKKRLVYQEKKNNLLCRQTLVCPVFKR